MQMNADEAAAYLARLRDSGIRIDREGRFWHEGQTVQHEGLRQALFRWLDRLPDRDPQQAATGDEGRYVLRLDARRFAYIDVDDTPLVATSLRWQDDLDGGLQAWLGPQAWLGLNDGSEELLDPRTLTIDGAGVLRCWVRGGKLEARLGTSAATTLAERIITRDERPALHTRDGVMVIPMRVQPV
jgi:hypothetical protein